MIILSHALWETRFGGDPAIIGRTLHISGRLIRVIGVLPESFQPMQPMSDYVMKSLADRVFALSLIGLLGALAMALAAVGVYGVVSYSVSLRTRELGVRMALGAGRNDVLWLVLKDLLRAVGLGLGIGLITAMALSRFLAHLLYGVPADDPVTIVTAGVTLTAVAVAAALAPCRRAIGIDPATALRHA